MWGNPLIRLTLSTEAAGDGLAAFDPQLSRLGLRLRSEMTIGRCAPPAEMTALLGVRSDVIFRRREVYARGGPVHLSTSYLVADRTDDVRFSWSDLEASGRYAEVAASGRPVMVVRAVTERAPDDHETAFLGLDGQRIRAYTRVTYVPDRRTLEMCVHAFPADRWDLQTVWPESFPQ